MADLEYTIKTKADTTGAKSQLDALNATTKAAKPPIEELAEADHKLAGQKAELLHQLKQVKHELPGLSELMHVIKNPTVALGVAVAWAIGKFKEFSAEVAELAKAQEPFSQIAAGAQRFREHAAEAKISATEFAHTLAKISEEADTAETRFTKLNAALEFQAKLEDDLRQKRLALAKAQVDLSEAEGKISPIEAARRKQALDEGAGGASRAATSRLAAAQYLARIGEISQTQFAKGGVEQALPGISAQRQRAQQASDLTARSADASIDAAKVEIEQLKKKKEASGGFFHVIPAGVPGENFAEKLENYRAQLDEEIQAQLEIQHQANTAKLQAEGKLKLATDAEVEAKTKIAEYAKALEKLEAERLAQRQQIDAAQAAAAQGGALESATGRTTTTAHELIERRKALEEYRQENEELRTRRERGQPDSDVLEKRRATERILQDTGGIPLTRAADALETLPDIVERIIRAVDAVNARVNNLS